MEMQVRSLPPAANKKDIINIARVVELADTLDLGSSAIMV